MGIKDTNNNELVNFSTTASAVNEITVTNSATGNAPEISATGTDTNIDLKLTPKGTGKLNLDGIKFPNADGTANQVLQTNGSGVLSFATPAGGKVLQVLQVKKTDVFTTSSVSLVDVTGLTLSITPSSASNKILFMASVAGIGTDNAVVQALRGATIIAAGDAAGDRTRSFTGSLYNGIFGAPTLMTASINWLDEPNTTSAVTYKIQAGAVGGGTLILGRNNTDNNDPQHTRALQVITLMEIAG